jgi:nitrogen fixation protein
MGISPPAVIHLGEVTFAAGWDLLLRDIPSRRLDPPAGIRD